VALIAAASAASQASAQSGDDVALAKQLANPVSSLISVPFQYNYNRGYRPGDGYQSYVNIQPVIPFPISENWNVISRTIIPVVYQKDVAPNFGSQFGLGSTTQSFFFSPKVPTASGLIWGVGPVFLLPTSTDDLGTDQWGAGGTVVGLRQTGPWTVGFLGNHIWSLTDDDKYGEISNTFLQPFLNYTTKKATSFVVNTESTYDWTNSQWSVPINADVFQLVKIGGQRVQLGGGARYLLESPDNGPHGWGLRAQLTFLFPR
jgi:hypothetical protein